MLPGFARQQCGNTDLYPPWVSQTGETMSTQGRMSTYLRHLSAKAHTKHKCPDKQAETKSKIPMQFANVIIYPINLFCHLLVRTKVNLKSKQATSPGGRGVLLSAGSTARAVDVLGISARFFWLSGQSTVVHLQQG